MCGIVGIFNYKKREPVDSMLLSRMTDCIRHRGPDGEGFYYDNPNGIGFGHRRLSIIDLSNGAQPMSNEDETIWITYNGELYNFKELKEELKNKHLFRTSSDTEVIIHAYEEWGEECLKKFVGIFAFAIWDSKKERIFLARDHFGVKPLYYFDNGTLLIFSSEIKAILLHPVYRKAVDLQAINQLFTLRFILPPLTGFQSIHKLHAGNFLSKQNGLTTQKRYWYLPNPSYIKRDHVEEELHQILKKIIRRQLISDVPIGVYLSGGLDSSLIAKEIAINIPSFHSFTMEFFDNQDMNEGKYAKLIADQVHSEHQLLKIGAGDYINNFRNYVKALEEPIANISGICWLFLSKAVRDKGIKVILCGQGSDEVFGGYDKYIGENYHQFSKFLLSIGGSVLFNLLQNILPRKYKQNNQFTRAITALQIKDETERFIAILTILQKEGRIGLFKKEFLAESDYKTIFGNYLQGLDKMDSVNKLMFLDTFTNLPDNLLTVADKANMTNSVEVRVPFLDVELVNYAFSLPASYKIKYFKGKYVYKKILEKYFNKPFINRRKIGFDSPIDRYFNYSHFQDYFWSLVKDKNSFSSNYFNPGYIENLLHEHINGKKNNRLLLFQILTLEMWYKEYFPA